MHTLKDLTSLPSDKLLPEARSIGSGTKRIPQNQSIHFLFGQSHVLSLAEGLPQLYSSCCIAHKFMKVVYHIRLMKICDKCPKERELESNTGKPVSQKINLIRVVLCTALQT